MEGYSKPISKTTCYDIELWLPKDSLFQSSQRFCRNGFFTISLFSSYRRVCSQTRKESASGHYNKGISLRYFGSSAIFHHKNLSLLEKPRLLAPKILNDQKPMTNQK